MMTVTMWEAKAGPGGGPALAAWVLANAPADGEVYASADDRVVVIATAPLELPDVPVELLDRAPHAWDFQRLR